MSDSGNSGRRVALYLLIGALFIFVLMSVCGGGGTSSTGSSASPSKPMSAKEAASQYYYDAAGHIQKK